MRLAALVCICLCAEVMMMANWAGEYRVTLSAKPPKIDGKFDPAEWAASAGFEGFVRLGDGKLERRRARGYVMADAENIYVAILSQLPDEGALAATVKVDSLKAVYDDSVEVYICPEPDSPDRVDYQFLVNSLGKGGYNIHKTGNPHEDVSWQGKWKSAHSQADGWWVCECAIPIDSMGTVAKGRKTTDGIWTVNLTRNWKPDWGWSSLSGGYPNSGLRFVFTHEPAPSVRHECEGDLFLLPAIHRLIVANPTKQPLALKAQMSLVRNNMPEIKEEKAISLDPGAEDEIKIEIAENDPTTQFELSLRVLSADNKTVYYDRLVKWPRAKDPYRYVCGTPKDAPPVDFKFAYYPSKNKLRVLADINGLPKDARLTELVGQIRSQTDKTVRKTLVMSAAEFKDGRCERSFDLPPLEGFFELAFRAEGENVPKTETVKTFERQRFPWENLLAGRSTKVYPPFTPMRVDGHKIHTVLREHILNGFGLWDQVIATSANTKIAKAILASPMRYAVKINGAEVAAQTEEMKIVSAKEHEVIAEGVFAAGALRATWRNLWDYDGCVKVELTLHPLAAVTGAEAEAPKLEALTLEIPFAADATLIHANSDRIRAPVAQRIPEGEGVLWDATKVACDDYIKNFCPYVYVGNAVRGICFFAENDRNWGWDPKTPNAQLVRANGQLLLRIHLVNQPMAIEAPRTLSFGLLAAPVKPMLNKPGAEPDWWRHRYYRDNYSLLGTDINWLAWNTCGAVYPAGQDLALWEVLARGNREKLSDEEIEQVVARAKRYYEGYGEDAMKSWIAHIRHNLRSRYGTKMIFYYNRASAPVFPEFETFKDEWCLDDFRATDKSKAMHEIKVVPTESYIDYNLYWYARSFEIGNNQGVYWDNWFIAPSFNTEMTEAYRKPDGSIVPAAGIWRLRELCKRTFVMMNERGMLPIVFPHMTSFSPLPMLSFATVQYEWEWKYSEGDVQDRFTRDYILLVTTGELAGVWPVPLGDHGPKANDPWTQRTFVAVRLVHELDGFGGAVSWVPATKETEKARKAVMEMLAKPGLQVYKYWEDRPQPAASNHPDVPLIVYAVPGKEALICLASYAQKDENITLAVDMKALDMPSSTVATDVESGETLAMANGKISFALQKHDMKVVRLAAKE